MSESEDGLPFFSMKYATGGSLADRGALTCAPIRASLFGCWPRSRAPWRTRTPREFCIATCNRETFYSMATVIRS